MSGCSGGAGRAQPDVRAVPAVDLRASDDLARTRLVDAHQDWFRIELRGSVVAEVRTDRDIGRPHRAG